MGAQDERAPFERLFLAAMTACRFNPRMRAVHQRMRDSGKPPKFAFIAVAPLGLTGYLTEF